MIVSIVGASGYVGGELLRLLHDHPKIELQQATSEKHVGEYIYQQHPNLRKRSCLSSLQFLSWKNAISSTLPFPMGNHRGKLRNLMHWQIASSIFQLISA